MSRFVDVTGARGHLGTAAAALLMAQRGLHEPTDMFPAAEGGANGPFVMMVGAMYDGLSALLDMLEELEPTDDDAEPPTAADVARLRGSRWGG